ncbi:MAG: ribulose phosphate epimerase [Glaciihabitans sp.]|nr:ribulose phosphate epimerase [Glaciihabitans sp.]
MTRLFASLTSIDVGELVPIVERLEEAGVDGFHIDLSDGVFTPGLLFGPNVVKAVSTRTTLPVEAHLMTTNPDVYVQPLVDAGARRVSFHWEATLYPWRTVSILEKADCAAGIAFNPATPVPDLSYLMHSVAFVNLLTTEPDVAGEKLLPTMAERVSRFRTLLPETIAIEVDGGIEASSAGALITAGASEVVMGRSLVSSPDPRAVIAAVRAIPVSH